MVALSSCHISACACTCTKFNPHAPNSIQKGPLPVQEGPLFAGAFVHAVAPIDRCSNPSGRYGVRLPLPQVLGHLGARRLELADASDHRRQPVRHLRPEHLVRLVDKVVDVDVERVEPLEQVELLLRLVELRVLGRRQPEELLARAVRLVLALALL
eukprot:1864193-Prymnesium_polylepis.1